MNRNINRTDEPDVFETTLHKTNTWVEEIVPEELRVLWPDATIGYNR